jgi:hypothetical protein
MLPDSASFVLVSVALLEDPCTEGMETYIEINLFKFNQRSSGAELKKCPICGNFLGG